MPRSLIDRMNAAALAVFPITAVLALLLSLPRFIEGMSALPGNAALEDIYAGAGNLDSISTVVQSRERTLSVIDRGKYHGELAIALVWRGQFETDNQKKATLDRAIQEGERSVEQAPADAWGWHRLAKASFARDGANQKAVDATLSSIAIAPYETNLLIERLEILFASRSYLSHQSDDIIDSQVRAAWLRYSTHFDLVRAIRRNGVADIVRRSLTREPSMIAGFEEALADPNIR